MKLTIENTDQVTQLRTPEGSVVPARIWQGETEGGIPVVLFVTRCAVPEGRPATDYAAFEAELQKTAPLRPELPPIDLRLVL